MLKFFFSCKPFISLLRRLGFPSSHLFTMGCFYWGKQQEGAHGVQDLTVGIPVPRSVAN